MSKVIRMQEHVNIGKNNILVTGCNGMLGHSVVVALLKEGYTVTGVSIEKETKCKHERYHYITADLTQCAKVEGIFRDNKFSHVIHLAAIAHVYHGVNISWSRYYRVNTLASNLIFECASEAGIPVFFSSTVDVYGITKKIINEQSQPHPIGSYAKSKYKAEQSLIKLSKQPYLIVRFAPIYTDEDKRDIRRRYYIKYPKGCYLLGGGLEYEFLYEKNAVNIILSWVKDFERIIGVVNARDSDRYNTRELARMDKQGGLLNPIIRIPKWLVACLKLGIKIVFYMYPYLKFTAYKLVSPMRTDCSIMETLFTQQECIVNNRYR